MAESPALWLSAADTAHGAFDDPADYAANTVFGKQDQLDRIAVRVDCGQGGQDLWSASHASSSGQ